MKAKILNTASFGLTCAKCIQENYKEQEDEQVEDQEQQEMRIELIDLRNKEEVKNCNKIKVKLCILYVCIILYVYVC